MDDKTLKNILEAGLLVAARVMSLAQLEALFQNDVEKPDRKRIRAALESLKEDYQGRGIELVEVASGYRLQSHESMADWVSNLFQEKAPRYSRALLETLVLIAYRQPITRAEIEDVRGVAVSSNIIKTLQERQWVKVLGHKEVPGRPALLGTTKEFLDYFNLKKLDELPALADIKDLDQFDELLAEEVSSENLSSENLSSENLSREDSDSAQSHELSESSRIKRMSAKLDSGGEDGAVIDISQSGSAEVESDTNDLENDVGTEADEGVSDAEHDPDDSMPGAERKLLRVIAEFSEEHQQEIDARDELESKILPSKDGKIDEADLGDMSQRLGDDQSPGDMPDPGDTLH